jgi:hypothetical protein
VGTDNFSKYAALFGKSWGTVTGKPDQEHVHEEAQHPHEELRAQAADYSK